MNLTNHIETIGRRALSASRLLAVMPRGEKEAILMAIADGLDSRRERIKSANATDLENGKRKGLAAAMLDRLKLDDARIDGMIEGVRDIARLEDPVGGILETRTRPNGLTIDRVCVPIGVIAIIYESRPNVTVDAAALCIKSSNAVILRGGSESIESNKELTEIIRTAGKMHGLPEDAVQFIDTVDREAVRVLVGLEGLVDLVIPRGGEELIKAVSGMARVPVIKHYKGVCHVYVDDSADIDKAIAITENAKCQRPGVCNAIETLLVHRDIAARFLPKVASALTAKAVELRGDEESRKLVPSMKEADEQDWYTEYLDLILSVKVVPDLRSAIDHINFYGSHHSDCIVTGNEEQGSVFAREVDSAAVYVNASTRFTDGSEFGMGAEMGISTDKLHARGPMGLRELTTYKYVIRGTGQIR
jgi:glutamate-5-semialdehyde dehydrogenase